jgi:hypothetical protein
MLIRKLFIIITGIFLVLTAGICNLYPIYLSEIQDKFKYSIREINLFGTFINIGLWVAFPMGFIYDKLGPKFSCGIGSILISGSFLAMHFILESSLKELNLIYFIIIAIALGQGSALCYTTSVTTNLKNFRFKEASSVVGLLVANMAISTSIFTTYREAFKKTHISTFFTGISILTFIVIIISAFIFNNLKSVYSSEREKEGYEKYKEKRIIRYLIFINLIILAIYTLGIFLNNLQENTFPLVYIYPALLSLNFLVVILEKFGVFDKFMFKNYIDRQVVKIKRETILQLNSNSVKVDYSSNEDSEQKKIKEEKRNAQIEEVNINKNHNNNINQVKNNNEDIINVNVDIVNDTNNPEKFNNSENEDNSNKSINNDDNNSNRVNNQIPIKQSPNNLIQVNLNLTAKKINPNEDFDNSISLKEAIFSKEFICLTFTLFFGVGSCIANINNVSFIFDSISKNNSSNTNLNSNNNTNSTSNLLEESYIKKESQFVILYFIFNSFTRLLSGLILDNLIKRKKFCHFLIIISCIGLLAQFFGIFMNDTCLFISFSFSGLYDGGLMTFSPTYIRNQYGLKNMGKIMGVLTTGSALGSLLIADLIFIMFYEIYSIDVNIKNVITGEFEKKSKCYGEFCFRYSYILTCIFSIINLLFAIYIFKRYNLKNSMNESISYNYDLKENSLKKENDIIKKIDKPDDSSSNQKDKSINLANY